MRAQHVIWNYNKSTWGWRGNTVHSFCCECCDWRATTWTCSVFEKPRAQNRVPHEGPLLILAGSIFGAPPNHFCLVRGAKTGSPLASKVDPSRRPENESPCARNMSFEITTRAHGAGTEIQYAYMWIFSNVGIRRVKIGRQWIWQALIRLDVGI